MLSVPQRYRRTDRQTDGRTDGRTTYDSNTALALRASRGKKRIASKLDTSNSKERNEDKSFCDMLCTEMGKMKLAPAKRTLKRKLMDQVYATQ